jgi:hypothetical protein
VHVLPLSHMKWQCPPGHSNAHVLPALHTCACGIGIRISTITIGGGGGTGTSGAAGAA